MISTSEIRLGNLLNCGIDEDDNGNEIPMAGRILQIFQNTVHWTNVLSQYDISEGYNSTDVRFINPIPLTPEWLERLGYIKDQIDKKWYKSPHNLPPIYCWRIGDYGMDGLPLSAKSFQYVHQLQNLYFALTGEELQIKEA